MMVNIQNVTISQITDVPLVVRLTDSDGNAITVTSYDFFFTIKKKESDPDANAVYKSAITDWIKSTNSASLDLTREILDLSAAVYFYDIQYINTSDNKIPVVKGDITVDTSITRRDT